MRTRQAMVAAWALSLIVLLPLSGWGKEKDPVEKAAKKAVEKHEVKGREDAKHPLTPFGKDRRRARKDAKDADKELKAAISKNKKTAGE